MTGLPRWAWLLLFSLAFQPASAQDDTGRDDNPPDAAEAEEAGAEQPAATDSDEQQVGDESPESPDDISRAFEDFVPSAQISEDLSVSFPVDI